MSGFDWKKFDLRHWSIPAASAVSVIAANYPRVSLAFFLLSMVVLFGGDIFSWRWREQHPVDDSAEQCEPSQSRDWWKPPSGAVGIRLGIDLPLALISEKYPLPINLAIIVPMVVLFFVGGIASWWWRRSQQRPTGDHAKPQQPCDDKAPGGVEAAPSRSPANHAGSRS